MISCGGELRWQFVLFSVRDEIWGMGSFLCFLGKRGWNFVGFSELTSCLHVLLFLLFAFLWLDVFWYNFNFWCVLIRLHFWFLMHIDAFFISSDSWCNLMRFSFLLILDAIWCVFQMMSKILRYPVNVSSMVVTMMWSKLWFDAYLDRYVPFRQWMLWMFVFLFFFFWSDRKSLSWIGMS